MIPTADRAKATVKVRIAIKQKDPRIIPEMGARVAFLSENEPGGAGGEKNRGTRAWSFPPMPLPPAATASIVFVVHGSTRGTARGPARRQNQCGPDRHRRARGRRTSWRSAT